MSEILIILAIPFLISLLLSLYVSPRMKIISYGGRWDINTSEERVSRMEVGGVPLFPILLISVCFTIILPHVLQMEELYKRVDLTILRLLQIIVGCAFLYIMGLKDDFHGIGTGSKVLILILTAAMFPASGLWINNLHGLFGIHALPYWLGMPFTFFLVLFLTQLPSISDSPDGLATGVCTLVVAFFLGLCLYGKFPTGSIISAATLGVTLPFWVGKRLGRKWEKTLIGSSGNYMLGYLMSYLSIGMIRQAGGTIPGAAIVICIGILFVPVMDGLRVLKDRLAEGRSLLKPDRNQMQHQFVRAGLPEKFVGPASAAAVSFFPLLNLLCVYLHASLTAVFLLDVLVWVLCRVLMDWLINRRETHYALEAWNKEYGREAWEANVPVEVLSRKVEHYGTMGLPQRLLSGDVNEFIPDGMSPWGRGIKRLFDLLASALSLIVFSPLALLCYLLIKLQDGGPAIYKQERIGRFGRPFYIYKFRSMRTDAEEFGPALSHAGGDDDPRLTKVGRFLRAHHLDELPQLWNVFIGDMSFVGYRPERQFFIDQIMEQDPRYPFLYQIRPGVTSYSTLRYGYTDTMEKMLRRLELDLYYLKSASLWFDIKVLFLTFAGIIFGKKF